MALKLTIGDHFRFGLIFIKKSKQTSFKKNEIESESIQTNQFRFGYFRTKMVQTSLARYFRFGLVFSSLVLLFFCLGFV